MVKLTDKQRIFVEEYMVDLNATQAAIRAGYSPATAAEQGCRLLKNVKIRACIDKENAKRSKRTSVTADRVIRELAKIAYANIDDIANFEDATIRTDALKDDMAAVSSVKVKKITNDYGTSIEREIRLIDKTKALELLGKHLNLFTEKIDINGNIVIFNGEDDLED